MAEMSFINTFIKASVRKLGTTVFDISAGKSLRVETSPQGDEILDVEVPAGKAWHVEMTVFVIETDA